MRNIVFGLAVFSILLGLRTAQAKYSGGTGEPNAPYRIATPNDLNDIGNHVEDFNKCFVMMNDIDLARYTGEQFNIIGDDWPGFSGVFDGNGHAIANFNYTCVRCVRRDYFGVFGLATGVEFRDIELVDPNVDAVGGGFVGSLVGMGGRITDCHVVGGRIRGGILVGGIAGFCKECSGCWAQITVSGDSVVGGLFGEVRDGEGVSECFSMCDVSGGSTVGGLAGVVGVQIIENSYADGDVTGDERVGGLIGDGSGWTTMVNCYSSSHVTGTSVVGGLVGRWPGVSFRCFWDVEASGQSFSATGKGLSTEKMHAAATYMGWGACSNAGKWTIDDGNDYPRLWWENQEGEILVEQIIDFVSGSGEPNDPYVISTGEELYSVGYFSCEWGKYFKLAADINLEAVSDRNFNIIGNSLVPFSGVFDGNDHTISNLRYDSEDTDYVGFFGYVSGPNAAVVNAGVIEPNVNAGAGSYVGGLVGSLHVGDLTGCFVEGGRVSGGGSVGGLVGESIYGEISRSYSTATVSGAGGVGGLLGHDYDGNISFCYAGGSVSGDEYVGGLVGSYYNGTIYNSYAEAAVSGTDYVGGLAGSNQFGVVFNSYSSGPVFGSTYVGGLVGAGEGTVGCFWDIETSGQLNSAGGIGLTSSEMRTAETFASWGGCGSYGVWTIDDGNDHPRLWWEQRSGVPLPSHMLSDFVSGSGDSNDPYLISTAEDFRIAAKFYCEWDKCFELTSDIDLNEPGGTNSAMIGARKVYPFSGQFAGNHQRIFNFRYISSNRTDYAGLFCRIEGQNTRIENLGVVEPNLDIWGEWCGAFAGRFMSGTIKGCYVEGGNIAAYRNAGGLAGHVSGTVTECYVKDCNVSGAYDVGGLAGDNYGTIERSYSSGRVCGTSGSVGGLVGENRRLASEGAIRDSYSTAEVEGDGRVGGLVGYNVYGDITRSYATGLIVGNADVGGLLGRTYHGTTTGSYWDVQTTGQGTSAGGTGLPTSEMQMESTFTGAGWDFNDVWSICEGTNYPRHIWSIPAADFVCPDGVNFIDYSFFSEVWLDDTCGVGNDFCGGRDLDESGIVDEEDLKILCGYWLDGI